MWNTGVMLALALLRLALPPSAGAASVDPAEVSEIKRTLSRAFTLIDQQDGPSLRQLLFAPDAMHAAWTDTLVEALIARQRLHAVSARAFGRPLAAAMESESNFFLDDNFKRAWATALSSAAITVDGDRARTSLRLAPVEPGRPATQPAERVVNLTLKKSEGRWLIDPSELIDGAGTRPAQHDPDFERQQRFFRQLIEQRTKAWRDVADDIELNAFKSYDDADKALRERL